MKEFASITKLTATITLTITTLLFTHVVQAAPKIQHWDTANGLGVYFVPADQLPMLDIELVFAGGSARDGDKPGVAMLTSGILNKGADGLNADELAEAFESVGAQYSASSGMERSTLGLRTVTLKDAQTKAIETWLKVLGKPEFPEKDFNRSKKQALIGLQAEKQNPGSIASKAFYENLYGKHPYASPEKGTKDSINAITIADLKDFYSEHYVAKNGTLVIVGDITRENAQALADKVSRAIKTGEKAASIPKVTPLMEAKTVRINFPSSQSHVYLGQTGNKRGDKDYFTLYLGNHVLGGSGFTSRLMKEIRVKRGLSYSVYSYFSPQRELGPYLVGLQTKNKQVDEAISVSRDELTKFLKDGPTNEELDQSKKNITGGFPLRTASNADIASYISMIGFYGLPLDYLDTFSKKINKISREDVMDAYKRRVHPEKMLTIIVGQQDNNEKDAQPANEENKENKENKENANTKSETKAVAAPVPAE